MLCESPAMKNSSYDQLLWNPRNSNLDNLWKRRRNFELNRAVNEVNLRPLSHSLNDLRQSFPTASKPEKVKSQQCYYYKEQTRLFDYAKSFESLNCHKPETEELEKPLLKINVEQGTRHVNPSPDATFPLPSNARYRRRASDGLLSSLHNNGRKVRPFSVLSEEDHAPEDEGRNWCTFDSGYCSVVATQGTNGRRFSDGCFRNTPLPSGVKKVSVVLPQPREHGIESTGKNGSESNSQMRSRENADESRNQEDNHWKELVAKAQGFKGSKNYGDAKFKNFQTEKGDLQCSLEVEVSDVNEISSEASFSSISSHNSSGESDTRPRNAVITKAESETQTDVASATRHMSVVRPSNAVRNNSRRYSVANCSPMRPFQPPGNTVKLSGYSTLSALEQARQLLGKLQTEAKLMTKKERLEELSRALKWILEELNRIETPDRELVQLFISLRAKIATLKSEVKKEEFDTTFVVDPSVMKNVLQMQGPVTDDSIANTRSRRFSWC